MSSRTVTWRVRSTKRVLALVIFGLCLYCVGRRLMRTENQTITETDHPDFGDERFINQPLDLSSAEGRKSRQEQWQRACAKDPDGDTMNILVYERKPSVRMSYCVVAKAGCTFWIRVFRFLNNDTGGVAARTPFDLDRSLTHDASRRTMRMYRLQKDADRGVVENSTRFMFTRYPFSRLWSAYVDKLVLPGLWSSVGRDIVARRPNATRRALACGHDVTFREFVDYVIERAAARGPGSVNGHWRPVHYVCDPCRFRPHLVGKQETFGRDAVTLLSALGLPHLLQGYDRAAHSRHEVALLADDNWRLLPFLPALCVTPRLLAERLWAAFTFNGHVSPFSNATRVLDTLAPRQLSGKEFKRLVYLHQERHLEEIQQPEVYRRKFMVDAFRSLPVDMLERFVAIYAKDFEYFGYDKRPSDIFH